jgi:fibronectin-binding autotransporter adhesin
MLSTQTTPQAILCDLQRTPCATRPGLAICDAINARSLRRLPRVASGRLFGAVLPLAIFCLVVAGFSVARAANDAWSTSPANANFSGANWTDGTTTPGAAGGTINGGDSLFFGASTITTLNDDETSGFSVGGITFNSGAAAFTIAGNALSLVSAGVITNASTATETINDNITLSGAASFTNSTNGTLTFGGAISGAGKTLTTNGGNSGVTAAANTIFGGSVTLASLVAQGNGSTAGQTAASNQTTTFGTGANLTTTGNVVVGRSNLVFKGSSVATIAGSITSTGAASTDWARVTIQDTANVTAATLSLVGSAVTGQFSLNGGTLTVGGISAIDSTDGTYTNANILNGTQIIASQSNTTFLTITKSTAFTGSSEVFVGTGGALFNSNGFNIGTATSFRNNGGAAGILVKSGNGTLTLSGSSFYTGGTTLSGGGLTLGNATTPLGTGSVTLSSGTLENTTGVTLTNAMVATANTITNIQGVSGNLMLNGNLTGSGTLSTAGTIGTSALYFGGNNSGFTGTLIAAGVNTRLGAASAASASAAYVINSGAGLNPALAGTYNLGSLSGAGNLGTDGGGASIVSVGALNTNTTFTGTITDTGNVGNASDLPAGTLALTKVGTGTLTLTGANTYTGATTISGGTLQVGVGTTVGSLSTSSAITDNATLAFDRSDTVTEGSTFASTIGGAGGNVTQLGSGNLILNAANGYTGATLVSAGTLTVSGAAGAINSSSGVTVNGSGAKFVQTSAVAGTIPITVTNGTLDGTGTVGAVSAGPAGIIANGAGGTGALNVGSVTFSGATGIMNLALVGGATTTSFSVIDAGAFQTPNSATQEIVVNFSGGALNGGSTYNLISYAGTFTGGASDFGIGTGISPRAIATSHFNVGGGVVSFTLGNIDTLIWAGTGNGGSSNDNWITGVTGSNTPTAGAAWVTKNGHAVTDYWAGDTVEFDDAPVTGPSGPITPSTTANISGASVSPGGITFNNNTLAYTITSDSPSHGIAGTNGITLAGTGIVNLEEPNTYTGATSVGAGTLNLVGGSLAGTAISVGAGTFTEDAASTISGAASLTNAGTVTLSGANTYTGATAANGGTLSLVAGSLAGTPITVGASGAFSEDSGSSITGGASLSSAGTTSLGGPTNTYTGTTTVTAGVTTLSGTINGSAVTVSGGALNETTAGVLKGATSVTENGGTATLAGNNTYTGNTTVGTAGTLILSGANNNGPTATTIVNPSTGGAGVLQLQANAGNTTAGVSTALGTASGKLTLNPGSTLQLRGNTNGTTFSGGDGLGGLGNAAITIDVNGAGAGNILLNFATTTGFQTAATQINVTGASNYTLGLGPLSMVNFMANSLTLNPTTANVSVASIGLGSPAGPGPITAEGAGNTTIGPITAGASTLTEAGPGTLFLTGANTYTGATTISGGTLQVGVGSTAGSLATTSAITDNATLAFDRSDTVTEGSTFASTIGGTGGVTQLGGGNLILNASNGYQGATLVSAGTLTVSGAAGAINSSSGVTINGSGAKFVQTSSVAGTIPITVTNGTLDGTGTVGAVSAGPAGIIANGAGTTGALNVGSVTFTGASGTMNLALIGGASTTSFSVVDAGAFQTPNTGTQEIVVNFSGGALNAGSTYDLISYAGTFTGGASDFGIGTGISPRAIATSSFNVGGGIVSFTAGASDTLVWAGTGNGGNANWITNTPNSSPSMGASWVTKNGHQTTDYWAGDFVEFDDAPVTGPSGPFTPSTTATITGASVTPGSITFNNNTLAYTILSDSPSHGITGNTSITLTGGGSVTLSEPNTYTGVTSVGAGTLNLVGGSLAGTAISVGTGTFTEDSASTISGAASLTNSAGTVTLSGANTYTGATAANGGTLSLVAGSLAGTPITVGASGAFTEDSASSITGAISLSSAGTTNLNGATNTYTGATTVNGGVTTLNGVINGSAITDTAGAFNESSTGAMQGATSLAVNNSATLAGINTNTGGISIGAAGTLQLQANATNTTGGVSSVMATQNPTVAQMPSGMTLQLRADNSVASGGVVAFDSGATAFAINTGGAAGRLSGIYNFDVNQLTGAGSSLTLQYGSPTAAWTIGSGVSPTTTINVTGGNGYSLQIGALTVGNNESLAFNPTGANLIINAITNATPSTGTVTMAGTGTLFITGTDTSTGATTINSGTVKLGTAGTTGGGSAGGTIVGSTAITVNTGGTLLLGAHDAVGTVSAINLSGGTLNAATFAEGSHAANAITPGMGTLTLSGASTLDFGTGSSGTDLAFTGGSAPGSYTLNIYDWNGSGYAAGGSDDGTTNTTQDRLLFATDPGFGALGTAISSINFFSDNGATPLGQGQEITFGSGVEIVPIAAVPEPTTILGALALLGLVGYRERKRFATLLRRAS